MTMHEQHQQAAVILIIANNRLFITRSSDNEPLLTCLLAHKLTCCAFSPLDPVLDAYPFVFEPPFLPSATEGRIL